MSTRFVKVHVFITMSFMHSFEKCFTVCEWKYNNAY